MSKLIAIAAASAALAFAAQTLVTPAQASVTPAPAQTPAPIVKTALKAHAGLRAHHRHLKTVASVTAKSKTKPA